MVGTRHLFDHLLQEVGLFGVVDGGGVISVEMKLGRCLMGRAQVLGEGFHAGLYHVEHSGGEGANRAPEFAAVGNHIRGLSRVHHGHRDHTGVHGFFVARDDALKGLHQLAGNEDRVNAVVGQGRV